MSGHADFLKAISNFYIVCGLIFKDYGALLDGNTASRKSVGCPLFFAELGDDPLDLVGVGLIQRAYEHRAHPQANELHQLA